MTTPRLSGLTTATWWRVLLLGAVAWVGAMAATAYTRDDILLPGVFLIGSFLVPFALLVLLLEFITGHWLASDGATALVPYRLLLSFAAGGALGVWPAALIEHVVTKVIPDVYFLTVATTEESIKLAIVWVMALGLASYRRRDGMVLGAAVGLGFSAFESFGYAYSITAHRALDIPAIIEVQLSRGVLTPVGHALWTALVAGALFAAASAGGRLRLTWSVVGWLGVAIALHAGWDVSAGAAALLVATWFGASLTQADFRAGVIPNPTTNELAILGVTRTLLLAVNAAIGLTLARWQWRHPEALADDGSTDG